MLTEKATQEWDLPHEYRADSGQPDAECRCGRAKAHELHQPPENITEKAAVDAPSIITEKGI